MAQSLLTARARGQKAKRRRKKWWQPLYQGNPITMSLDQKRHTCSSLTRTEEEELAKKRPKTGQEYVFDAPSCSSTATHSAHNTNSNNLIQQLRLQLSTALQQQDAYKKELGETRSLCEEQKKKIAVLEQPWGIKTYSYGEFLDSSEIYLRGSTLGDHEVTQVSLALQNPQCSVQLLNLSASTIRASGVRSLAGVLRVNVTLTELNLSACDLGDSGVQEIAASLPYNTTLRTLVLVHNNITSTGAEALATAISTCSLKGLFLSGNPIGTIRGGTLAKALQVNTSLTTLNLSSTDLDDAEAQELAAALPYNTTLSTLHLRDNKITDDGAKMLAKALRFNAGLKKLVLQRNMIGDDGKKALRDAKTHYVTQVAAYLIHTELDLAELAELVACNTTLETLEV